MHDSLSIESVLKNITAYLILNERRYFKAVSV